MTQPKISRLRGIALACPDATKAAGFYADAWGLTKVHDEPGAAYFRASGPEHHVLSLHDRAAKGIAYLNFAAQDEASLRALRDHIEARGARIVSEIAALATPGGGIGFETVDPDNRVLRISAAVERYPDAPDLPDAPRKITHVVLNTPQLETSLQFYEEVLGFRVSDWSEDQMVFIRCNTDHHAIAFNRAAHASVNHIAFEMPSIDAEFRGIGRLKRMDTPVRWGVGRHGPGNNVFAYFTDPNGFVIEYTTEIEQIDEATHKPQVWKRVPHLMDRWGTAGPPAPEIRAAMAGVPDPGYGG
jgi:catechol-2,3-dioxygenase